MILKTNIPSPQAIPSKYDPPTSVYFVIRADAVPDGPSGVDFKHADVNHPMCFHDLESAMANATNSVNATGKNEWDKQYFICRAISVVRREAAVIQPLP